jgi:hypothetical protein
LIGLLYHHKAHQGNGGTALSFDNALAFYREQQTVLAYNAELDRATHSPFDVTNNNTFLGKIFGNLAIATAGRGNSILGQIGSLSNFTSAMRAPITINANAATELEFREQINWDSSLGDQGNTCVGLSTIGAVGDMFCNPLRGSDFSTVSAEPNDIFWKTAWTCTEYGEGQTASLCSFKGAVKKVEGGSEGTEFELALEHGDPFARCRVNTPTGLGWGTGNCNGTYYEAYVFDLGGNGLEQINQNSDLAKMIKWGVNRSSDPGTTDINIMQQGQVSTGTGWLDSLLGAIPIVGDVMDIVGAVRQNKIYESGWADGSAFCVGCVVKDGKGGEYDGREKWESVYKYLDQYIIDNNLYENMEAIEKSPVTAYIDDVLWPEMDKSYEGVLAANMGVTKAAVVNVLAYVEDLRSVPRDADSLVASAPNIYATYYGGKTYGDLEIQEQDETCGALALMRECTQIAGTELRRRFNAEAVA